MKRRIAMIMVCLMTAMGLQAQDEWNTVYPQIMARIKNPTFRTMLYRAGVKPNFSAKRNQEIINKTIEQCSKQGGGRVQIPAGRYMTGAITMQSNVNLMLEEGAELVFDFDRSLYPLVYTRWEGMDSWNYQPCIYAIDCKNIAITGRGTINGNANNDGNWWYMKGLKRHGWHEGVDEWQGTAKEGSRADLLKMSDNNVPADQRRFGKGKGLRPQLVNFVRCENVLIENVKLINSPFWVIHPVFCKNMTVRGAYIYNNGPNGDGCDPESCEDVLIENCTFQTGDDCIALKSGRNGDGRRANIPCKNIVIRKCKMKDGHGGVVIGSEVSGGCDNVFAEDCDMDSPNLDRVLRIKSNTCRGGVLQNIFMRNIRVGQCNEAVVRINLMYEPNEIAERGHVPTVRNVFVENVTCRKSKHGILINGLDEESQIYNVNVTNCRFGGLTAEPVLRTGKSHDINIDRLTVSGSLK